MAQLSDDEIALLEEMNARLGVILEMLEDMFKLETT